MAGCMDTAIEALFEKYSKYILKQKVYTTQETDGQMIFEPFAKTAESAARWAAP